MSRAIDAVAGHAAFPADGLRRVGTGHVVVEGDRVSFDAELVIPAAEIAGTLALLGEELAVREGFPVGEDPVGSLHLDGGDEDHAVERARQGEGGGMDGGEDKNASVMEYPPLNCGMMPDRRGIPRIFGRALANSTGPRLPQRQVPSITTPPSPPSSQRDPSRVQAPSRSPEIRMMAMDARMAGSPEVERFQISAAFAIRGRGIKGQVAASVRDRLGAVQHHDPDRDGSRDGETA